jgi:hypothetical protein
MKKVILFCISLLLVPFFGFSQTTIKFDSISPFHEGFSALKKGKLWGFINEQGILVIDFRDDLVVTEMGNNNYPIFKNNRCLISEKKEGIRYFGYVDTTGKTVIAPQYLNATNFAENIAIAIKVHKNIIGENDVLKKQVVRYESSEVLINSSGEILKTLIEAKGLVLSKKYLYNAPKITSKLLGKNLLAVLRKDHKWELIKI